MGHSDRVQGAGEPAIAGRGGRGFLMGGVGRPEWALRFLDSNLGGSRAGRPRRVMQAKTNSDKQQTG